MVFVFGLIHGLAKNHVNKHGHAHDITDGQTLSLGIDVAKFCQKKTQDWR
jgi:hypothetical protein